MLKKDKTDSKERKYLHIYIKNHAELIKLDIDFGKQGRKTNGGKKPVLSS